MSPQCCARLCITSAEKYNPSDSPMTQRPNLLNGAGHRVGMPATRVAAVRNSGPSSQGNGVPIQTARPAPTRAMQRPRMTGCQAAAPDEPATALIPVLLSIGGSVQEARTRRRPAPRTIS